MSNREHQAPDGPIPDNIRAFYDPNDHFDVPDKRDGQLLAWLDARRQQPIVLPHLGATASRQLLAAELAHAGLIDETNAADQTWLGIPEAEVEQTLEAAHFSAVRTAELCLSAITRIRRRRSLSSLAFTPDTTLAGAILSANAHKGQTRLDGKPYYSHPQSVALLLNYAFHHHLDETSDPSLTLYEFDALNHDGWEDAFPEDGTSFLTSPNLIPTPLVVDEVLRRLDHDPLIARRHAMGLHVLTKTVGPGPNGPERTRHWPYILKFADSPWQIPPKVADEQHNDKINPKPMPLDEDEDAADKTRKLYLQKENYHEGQQTLIRMYGESDLIGDNDWFSKQLFVAYITKLRQSNLGEAYAFTPWAAINHRELITAYEDAAAA